MTEINLLKFVILLIFSLGFFIAAPICYFQSGREWFDGGDRSYKFLAAAIILEIVAIIFTIIAVTIVMFSFYAR